MLKKYFLPTLILIIVFFVGVSTSLLFTKKNKVPETWQKFEWQSNNPGTSVPFSIYAPLNFSIRVNSNIPVMFIGEHNAATGSFLTWAIASTETKSAHEQVRNYLTWIQLLECLQFQEVSFTKTRISNAQALYFENTKPNPCTNGDMILPWSSDESIKSPEVGYIIQVDDRSYISMVMVNFETDNTTQNQKEILQQFKSILSTFRLEWPKKLATTEQILLSIASQRDGPPTSYLANPESTMEVVDSTGSYVKKTVLQEDDEYTYLMDKYTAEIKKKEVSGNLNSRPLLIQEEAYQKVLKVSAVAEYLKTIPNSHLDFEPGDTDESWVFHLYEVLADHTATGNWYTVNKKTGVITDLQGNQYFYH